MQAVSLIHEQMTYDTFFKMKNIQHEKCKPMNHEQMTYDPVLFVNQKHAV